MGDTANGRLPRKQLADQLDRFDSILDGLSDALNESVADAAREGAKAAVKEILGELLANPELRSLLAGLAPQAPSATAEPAVVPTPRPAPAKPSLRTRLGNKLAAVKKAVVFKCKAAMTTVTTAAGALSAVMPLRKVLIVGAVIGTAVGLGCYVCPHGVTSVVAGVGGTCAAVAAQAGMWLRRSLGLLGFAAVR